MKTIYLSLFLGAAVCAPAQSTFKAVLTTPGNPVITGAAAFILEGTAVSFTISFNLENVMPTLAQLVGPQSSFTFDLGTPFVVVHSPGPWPNGYDGSTAFFGAFTLPDNLREDFVAGRTTLQLPGSRHGDFSGPVLPASPPQIASFSRQGPGFRFSFLAEPPYRYTVEHLSSMEANPLIFTNVSALSQTFEAVVIDPSIGTGARFYRIRRDLCCQ